MKVNLFHFLFVIVCLSGCKSKESDAQPGGVDVVLPVEFKSVHSLLNKFSELSLIENSNQRNLLLDSLWKSLHSNRRIPFTIGDSVVLMYRGNAQQVRWAGDFNGWNPQLSGFTGVKLQGTDVFYCIQTLPENARVDYKIVVDNNWIIDPSNPFVQYSGFGPNSELRMPVWKPDSITFSSSSSAKGTFSNALIYTSIATNLNYQVSYRVYIPYGFSVLDTLPLVMVTDGHEYSDEKLGAMIQVLDNGIAQRKFKPLIAVFIDPRNPANGANRRMSEYRANPAFLRFVADELTPYIRQEYHTSTLPSNTAIMGTSLGGWNAAYFGVNRSDVFGKLIIHSPAFNQDIIDAYAQSATLPLKVFMSTGTIFDTQTKSLQMRQVLLNKGYDLMYIEVNEGHSWGNWRALIDEPLQFLFP